MFKNNPFHEGSHLRRAFRRRRDLKNVDYSALNDLTSDGSTLAADMEHMFDALPYFEIPSPLDGMSLEQVLQGQLNLAGEIMSEQGNIILAARHLIDVMAMKSSDGHPVFRLNEDSPFNNDLLIHAVIDLQAKLNGTELPHFALPAETEIN